MKQNQGHNPTVPERPNNNLLVLKALFKCVMSGFTGAVIAAALCLFIGRLPFNELSLTFIALNTLVGLIVFCATHFPEAKRHKAAFISAGGDPTGITLFAFGSLRFL